MEAGCVAVQASAAVPDPLQLCDVPSVSTDVKLRVKEILGYDIFIYQNPETSALAAKDWLTLKRMNKIKNRNFRIIFMALSRSSVLSLSDYPEEKL